MAFVSIEELEEEEKKKNFVSVKELKKEEELQKLLKEESKEEDFISAEKAGIKNIPPIRRSQTKIIYRIPYSTS